jgi:hypothetical protein
MVTWMEEVELRAETARDPDRHGCHVDDIPIATISVPLLRLWAQTVSISH